MSDIEKIEKLLGIKAFEEFDLGKKSCIDFNVVVKPYTGDTQSYTEYYRDFRFQSDGLLYTYNEKLDGWQMVNYETVHDVLCGEFEILTHRFTRTERKYLNDVMRPFMNPFGTHVDSIIKVGCNISGIECEFIRIFIKNGCIPKSLETIDLPKFNKGSMYKGIEVNKEYSLIDLRREASL